MCRRCGYPWIVPAGAAAAGRTAPPTAPAESRCSECGSVVDPSTHRGLRWSLPGMGAQWLMRAPGMPMLLSGLAAAGVLFYGRSVPTGYWKAELGAVGVLAALAILWAVSAAIAAVMAHRVGRLRDAAKQRGWWFVPLTWAAAVAIACTSVPIEVGFMLRRTALDSMAAAWRSGDVEALRAGHTAGGPYAARNAARNAGTLSVMFDGDRPMLPLDACNGRLRVFVPRADQSDPKWNGLVVAENGTSFLFELGGYLYLPDLPPEDMPAGTFLPLGDGWWQGMVAQD